MTKKYQNNKWYYKKYVIQNIDYQKEIGLDMNQMNKLLCAMMLIYLVHFQLNIEL